MWAQFLGCITNLRNFQGQHSDAFLCLFYWLIPLFGYLDDIIEGRCSAITLPC